jgi:hypothetical protein
MVGRRKAKDLCPFWSERLGYCRRSRLKGQRLFALKRKELSPEGELLSLLVQRK